MENLGYSTATTDRHNVAVRTWQENGDWYVKIDVDGVTRSYEHLGPDVVVTAPQPPSGTSETPVQSVLKAPVKKRGKR